MPSGIHLPHFSMLRSGKFGPLTKDRRDRLEIRLPVRHVLVVRVPMCAGKDQQPFQAERVGGIEILASPELVRPRRLVDPSALVRHAFPHDSDVVSVAEHIRWPAVLNGSIQVAAGPHTEFVKPVEIMTSLLR